MDREHLGKRVKQQRVVLGLSVSRAARAAGISRPTWTAVEEGTRQTEPYTYGPIERVLEWSPGSIEAVLAGGDPTPRTDAPARPPTVIARAGVAEGRGEALPATMDTNADNVVRSILEIFDSPFSADVKIHMARDAIARDWRPGNGASGNRSHQAAG